ncbi:MAG: hypothetical protein HYZ42_13025, partial [Bacteroidetes bacterium]|nr:hypothetical protein [Bacteroidota bacterium]
MSIISNKTKVIISLSAIMVLLIYLQSCKKDDLLDSENGIEMLKKLSDYHIYQGNQLDLIPTNGYE